MLKSLGKISQIWAKTVHFNCQQLFRTVFTWIISMMGDKLWAEFGWIVWRKKRQFVNDKDFHPKVKSIIIDHFHDCQIFLTTYTEIFDMEVEVSEWNAIIGTIQYMIYINFTDNNMAFEDDGQYLTQYVMAMARLVLPLNFANLDSLHAHSGRPLRDRSIWNGWLTLYIECTHTHTDDTPHRNGRRKRVNGKMRKRKL